MIRLLAAYGMTFIVMVVIDLLWLGVIAKPLYQQGIGHLMVDPPKLLAAGLFYLLFPLGLMIFAVAPPGLQGGVATGLGRTLMMGALFGFFAYATYDLTNLATLKGWPLSLALLDMAWGTAVSALAAAAGKAVLDRV